MHHANIYCAAVLYDHSFDALTHSVSLLWHLVVESYVAYLVSSRYSSYELHIHLRLKRGKLIKFGHLFANQVIDAWFRNDCCCILLSISLSYIPPPTIEFSLKFTIIFLIHLSLKRGKVVCVLFYSFFFNIYFWFFRFSSHAFSGLVGLKMFS
jgi:hypothetical protein